MYFGKGSGTFFIATLSIYVNHFPLRKASDPTLVHSRMKINRVVGERPSATAATDRIW